MERIKDFLSKVSESGVMDRAVTALVLFLCVIFAVYHAGQDRLFVSGVFAGFFAQFVVGLILKGVRSRTAKVAIKYEARIGDRSAVYTIRTQTEEEALRVLKKIREG